MKRRSFAIVNLVRLSVLNVSSQQERNISICQEYYDMTPVAAKRPLASARFNSGYLFTLKKSVLFPLDIRRFLVCTISTIETPAGLPCYFLPLQKKACSRRFCVEECTTATGFLFQLKTRLAGFFGLLYPKKSTISGISNYPAFSRALACFCPRACPQNFTSLLPVPS